MKTSIARKVLMALSGFFLLFFLAQHLAINSLSVFSEDAFNSVSHFMGTNFLVQFILQPVLIFGVIFHLVMGLYLDVQNQRARSQAYVQKRPSTNSSWMSRNMKITGITVLLFLALHFYDFWIHEINVKYVKGDLSGMNANGAYRYFEDLQYKFVDVVRVGLYVLSFVFLSLHLLHGFQSAFQSVGAKNSKNTAVIKRLGDVYAVVVPLGFIVIALYHYITQL